MDQRLKRGSSPDTERANAFGGIELVAGYRQEVDAQLVHLCWNFSDGLGGVGVEGDPTVPRDASDFRDRLDRADFIVGMHDGDHDRAR
jgi:hypothetical protein